MSPAERARASERALRRRCYKGLAVAWGIPCFVLPTAIHGYQWGMANPFQAGAGTVLCVLVWIAWRRNRR